MAFDDVRFPVEIGLGAISGPQHNTLVSTAANGREVRVEAWSIPLVRFDVSSGVKTRAQYEAVIAFHRARAGRARAFRFRDWADYVLPRRQIGTTGGSVAAFQITKGYTSGPTTRTRNITKPVAGTVRCWVNDIERAIGAGGTQFQVNLTTGVVTIGATLAATTGQAVDVSCEFDVPVRFESDTMALRLDLADIGEWPSIPLVEVRE
jgi:uncharacterized protein (TIGR02217 family)